MEPRTAVEDEANAMREREDALLAIREALSGRTREVFDAAAADEDDENDENDGWTAHDEARDDDEAYDDDVNDRLDALDALDDMRAHRGEASTRDARAAPGSAAAKLTRANVARPNANGGAGNRTRCLLYTSPSPRDATLSRMPSSA